MMIKQIKECAETFVVDTRLICGELALQLEIYSLTAIL